MGQLASRHSRLLQTVVAGLGAVGAGGLLARKAELAALMIMTALGLGVLLLLAGACSDPDDDEARARLMRWTVGAFAAHLAFGLLVVSSSSLTNYLGPDAVTYHLVARGIVDHWNTGIGMPSLIGGKEGFYYMLAAVYWVLGAFPSAGMALNAVLGAALVPLATDTTRRLFGDRAARYAPPLMLLLPGLFIWTSQLLKEAPVVLLTLLAANCAVRIGERVTLARAVTFVTAVALLLSFRGPIGLVVGVGLVAGIAVGRQRLASGLGAGVVVAGMIAGLVIVGGVGESGYQRSLSSNLVEANRIRQNLALGAESGYGGDVDTSTSTRALVYLPIGLFNFTLGPFPWQGGARRQLAALPDVLVWWLLLPALWRGSFEAARRIGRRSLTVFLPAASTWLLLALVVSNFGIVIRERQQVVVLVAPLIALGLACRSDEKAERSGKAVPSAA